MSENLVAEAKALMGNSAFLTVVESAKRDLITLAMNADPKDDDGRRRYLDAAKTVDRVVSHLNALILASKSGEEVEASDFYRDQAKERNGVFRKFIGQ